jgi:Fe-S-cluster containining protein
MAWRPALRRDVLVTADGLKDTLFGRDVAAGPVTRTIVEKLDGTRTSDEVLDATVAALPGTPREDAERSLRGLFLMNFVTGSGERIREQGRRFVSGAVPLNPVYLEEARFQCQGSGQCCRVYVFGPVADEDVERIKKLDIVGHYPHLAGRVWFEKKPEGWFLNRDGNRCVFLKDDMRCGLHAAFGAESKPSFCRRYPWAALTTIEGLKVYDQTECATFATSSRAGDSLAKQLEWLTPLFKKNQLLTHPVFHLDLQTPCDYGWLLQLQQRLVALGRRPAPTAGARLQALGRLARAFTDALLSCPLREGEPDATANEVLSRDLATFEGREPEGEERRAGMAMIANLAIGLLDTIDQLPPTLVGEQLGEALGAIARLASHLFDPENHPCEPELLAALRHPYDPVETADVLRMSMLNFVFADLLLLHDHLGAGLLRLALTYLITIVGAKLRAHGSGAPKVRAEDLSFSHSVAMMGLRRAELAPVVAAHEPLLWGVFAAAPDFAEGN